MYLNDIEATCFIMALFIRDDGLRFLLGTGAYEFKDSQLHFSGNTIENDVVSVQGNDGYMLAGQVRRPSTQVFDGYIGDATVSKAEVEGFRRDFFTFFRKNHFYTVVYVLPDGSAIQRRRGFLVDAPTVKELRQMYPEYHVGLNFEDVNYYKYAEDDAGQEIYGKSADIGLAKAQFGGLIWDDRTQTQINKSGSDFAAIGTIGNEPIDSIELQGDTQQTTISGAQLLTKQGMATPTSDTAFWNVSGSITQTALDDGWATFTKTSVQFGNLFIRAAGYNCQPSTTYTVIIETKNSTYPSGSMTFVQKDNVADPVGTFTIVAGCNSSSDKSVSMLLSSAPQYNVYTMTTKSETTEYGIRQFLNANNQAKSIDLRTTVLLGDHSSDWQNYVGDNWKPYVGGVASPNPDYPQEVQTVTGLQTIKVMDATKGKNLYDKATAPLYPGFFNASGLIKNFDKTLDNNYDRWTYIQCEPNTTYTVTKPLQETTSRNRFRLGTLQNLAIANDVQLDDFWRMTDGDTTTTHTITTGANAHYLCLYFGQATSYGNPGGEMQAVMDGIQIEKGSEATLYVPYTTQTYEVNLGKNILDNIGVTETKAGGITFTVNADKSVTVSGVATGANWFKLSEGLQLDGDYFLSGCPSGGGTTKFSLQTSFSGTVSGDYGSGVQLHAGTTDQVWIVVRSGQDFSTPATFYPQIEKGYGATSYSQYFTPIELCKIGDYQDYIYKTGGDWFIHKETKKTILDGTEDWINSPTVGYTYTRGQLDGFAPVGSSCFCNMFTRRTGSHGQYEYIWVHPNSGTLYLQVNDSRLSAHTLGAFKSWLETNNPVVYSVLNTPTNTQITNADLIAQLEAINAVAIKHYNTLAVSSPNLPASLVLVQGANSHLEPYVYYNGKFEKVQIV